MRLQFETMPEATEGIEIPILVSPDTVEQIDELSMVTLDGAKVEVGIDTFKKFQSVVSKMQTERIPDSHYRDCIHFLFAMNDIWVPTQSINTWANIDSHNYIQEHDTSTPVDEYVGPIGFGIPNDSRCLGFGDAVFVPSHCGLGVETSAGVLYLQKLGTEPHFSLADFDQSLGYYNNEIAYPITRMELQAGESICIWKPDQAAV